MDTPRLLQNTFNLSVVEKFENEFYGTHIRKLFFVAAAMESADLDEFLQEMIDDDIFIKLFPEISVSKVKKACQEKKLRHLLLIFKKLGFIAQIAVPHQSNYRIEKGEIKSFHVSKSVLRIAYVYADTIDLLLEEIENCYSSNVEDFKRRDISNK